jgi:hypothetical protein
VPGSPAISVRICISTAEESYYPVGTPSSQLDLVAGWFDAVSCGLRGGEVEAGVEADLSRKLRFDDPAGGTDGR